jgi:hypothetical protein
MQIMLISRKIFISILFILLNVLAASAQEQQSRPIMDFDHFPGETFAQEKARLDRVAQVLKTAPLTTRVSIIAYGGPNGSAGEAKKRAKLSKDYLMRKHGIAASRIITIDGGYRELVEVEHFIVPEGVIEPTPSPSVSPNEVHLKPGRNVKRNH